MENIQKKYAQKRRKVLAEIIKNIENVVGRTNNKRHF